MLPVIPEEENPPVEQKRSTDPILVSCLVLLIVLCLILSLGAILLASISIIP